MPPAKSGLFGPCTIWNLDEDTPDGGNFQQLTSRPYPVESIENLHSSANSVAPAYGAVSVESAASNAELLASSLKAPLIEYETEPENLQSTSVEITGGSLEVLLVEYETEPENLDSSATIMASALDTVLIRYEDWPPESVESTGAAITGGTLT